VAGLVEINVNSTTWMTKIVLGDADWEGKPIGDGMLKRRRGAIVNTSSAAGRQVSPLLAGYSGAKGFVVMFSKSLNAELAPKGIHVQVQTPLYVTTKLAKIRKTSLSVPSPEAYVRWAAAHIGYEAAISPYWSHALQLWVADLLPAPVAIAFVGSMHHGIRKAGIKKEAKKRAEAKAD
jgi:17beta-estradiol 17-dehydrogenase / very-long-chain 3-oxoacyl-CoA reductase